MKFLYTFLFLILTHLSGIAQDTLKTKVNFKGGINIATITVSNPNVNTDYNSAFGSIYSYRLGAYVAIPASKAFYIEPGIVFNNKGFSTNASMFSNNNIKLSDIKTILNYLEIPITAVFKNKAVYFGGGPYVAYAISGKYKITGTTENSPNNVTSTVKTEFGNKPSQINPLDFGINFTFGLLFTNRFNFGVNYGIGLGNLTNNAEGENEKSSNRVIAFSLGYEL